METRASECMVEFVCTEGVRRERMRRVLTGVAVVALGLCAAGARTLRADNRPAPKGPDEDGTKPALVKIAGEGLMDSHAFEYLTLRANSAVGARSLSPQPQSGDERGASL